MNGTDAEPLYVLFTMDCLPPNGPPMILGPSDWQEAQRGIRSFADALQAEGLSGTFFVAPEGLSRFAETGKCLREAGMELGVLCHPQLSNYQSYLGSYGYDREREIIQLHKRMWQDRLGEDPLNFRAGFFSCSDYTFQILCLEGFQQASCSLPGRIDPEQCSIWHRAYPFPHHTDPLDRKAAGTMELYEAPVTSEFEATGNASAETYTPPHLRIEEPDLNAYAEGLAESRLDRMEAEGAAVKALTFVTQNSAGWGGDESPLTERLHNLASLLNAVADRRGMRLAPGGLEALHRAADELWHKEMRSRLAENG